jgi:parvulin-like peptidyl-prolyl isomerase
MRGILQFILGIVLSCLVLGCAASRKKAGRMGDEQPDGVVFAESSLMDITVDMMARRFDQDQLPYGIQKIDSLTAWKTVYGMLLDSALYQRADTFSLKEKYPLIYFQYFKRVQDRIVATLFDVEIASKIEPDSAEIEKVYEENKEKFKIPDQYRARHIVISGPGLKAKDTTGTYDAYAVQEMDSIAHQKVENLRELVLEGHSFDSLAELYSLDPNTAPKGGDLGYFELSQMVEPFDSAVHHTPQGEVSGLVHTNYGWHILIVDDFRPEHYTPIDSVWVSLVRQYKEYHANLRGREFRDSVVEASTLVLDTALLKMSDTVFVGDKKLGVANPDDTLFGRDSLLAQDYYRIYANYLKSKGVQDGSLTLDEKLEVAEVAAVKLHLIRAARELGITKREDFVKWRTDLYRGYAISQMRKELLDDNYYPTDDEVQKYYEQHEEDFVIEKPIYVQHIVFADSNYALHVRDMALSGNDFIKLAKEYYPGEPDIREIAADLGYIGKDEMPEAFWKAANRTPVGEISMPVKTEFGYHIIKVVDKQYSLSVADASAQIRTTLMKEHQQDLLRKTVHRLLRKKPRIHYSLLDQLYRIKAEPPVAPGTLP